MKSDAQRRLRNKVWIAVVALLLVATGGAYAFLLHRKVSVSDQVGLMYSNLVREEVGFLRVPDHYPNHPSLRISELQESDSAPFISLGSGMPGDCSFYLLADCLSFAVGSEIEKYPDRLKKLMSILERPCDFVSESVVRSNQDVAREKEVGAGKGRHPDQSQRALLLVNRKRSLNDLSAYFGCERNHHPRKTILLNFMTGIDRAGRSAPEAAYQISRQVTTNTR